MVGIFWKRGVFIGCEIIFQNCYSAMSEPQVGPENKLQNELNRILG
jgi:hypothetical protein